MDTTFENDAQEIARRVLKSYGGAKEPEEDMVRDLGDRIHKAAVDLANERAQEVLDVADTPVVPGTTRPSGNWLL